MVTALENRIKARGVFLVFKNAKTGKIPREPP
nr:MAG TPA: 30S ribosomal protein S2 [Inoviridae sp.]DAU43066.1 MAG TPA: 30S ribosomal protein S2 [Inoviridae sp.]